MSARSEALSAQMLPPPTPVSMSSSFATHQPLATISPSEPCLPATPASMPPALRSPRPRTVSRPANIRHSWGVDSTLSDAPSSTASEDLPPAVKAVTRKLLVLKADLSDKLWDLRRHLTPEGVEAVQTTAVDGITALLTEIRSLSTQSSL